MRSLIRRVRSCWRRFDAWCPGPVKETGILALGLVLVDLVVFLGLRTDHAWYNPYTAYLIMTVFAFAIVVMLWGTPFWTFRVVGVLFLVIGDAFIYGPIILALHDIGYNEQIRLSLARGFFVVGSIFVLYGLTRWVIDYKRGTRSMESTPTVLTRGDILE